MRTTTSTTTEARGSWNWRDEAACRGRPSSWFFGANKAELTRGRACCCVCPVESACLWWAMGIEDGSGDERFGTWGGASPATRAFLATRLSPGQAKAHLDAILADHCSGGGTPVTAALVR
ncbi:MAG: WhiB family transcriptional regulator [Acidimicrobiales bacterium]